MMKVGLGAGVPAAAALALGLAGQTHAQTPFTDWESVLKPGATVAVGGVAQEFTSTAGPSGVTSVAPPSTNMAATFSQTFNAAGEITSMAIQNANRTVGFHRAYGDSISFIANDRLIYGLSSDWTRKAIAADPLEMGWKYQSFGAWVSGLGQPQGSMGAASVGAITAGTSVPQSGSASFTGLMGGIYNDASGQDHLIAADMDLAVNFGAHTANFWTSNTADTQGRRRADLDITGQFLSLPNHPALFGTLSTDSLTGTSSAQFYGPNADEVGGVFTMTPKSGQGLQRLSGAFGGARQPSAAAFEGWATSFKPNATVGMVGEGRQVTLATVNGRSIPNAVSGATEVTLVQTLDGAGGVAFARLATPNPTISLSARTGARTATLGGNSQFLKTEAGDGSSYLAYSRPLPGFGANYHSYGLWEAGVGSSSSALGVFAVGAQSPLSAVPTIGSWTFYTDGLAFYVDQSGNKETVSMSVQFYVNYEQRTALFSTSTDFWSYRGSTPPRLIGNLRMDPGQARFTGPIRTQDSRMIGEASARFFGPRAQEIGGTFAVSAPSGPERLVGAFGSR